MTLDEAKKLEHGDRVLVEMEVIRDSFFGETCSAGAVYIRAIGMEDVAAAVKPKFIRKKIETSRKFKKGDIVKAVDNYPRGYFEMLEDERDGEIELRVDGESEFWDAWGARLVCAAEDREDRKGEA